MAMKLTPTARETIILVAEAARDNLISALDLGTGKNSSSIKSAIASTVAAQARALIEDDNSSSFLDPSEFCDLFVQEYRIFEYEKEHIKRKRLQTICAVLDLEYDPGA